MFSWSLIIVGGILTLLPMYVNPTVGINGLTLLGIVVLVAGVSRALTERKDNV
jgi:hypothetical protein